MTNLDRFVVAALLVLGVVLAFGRQGPETGRRPLLLEQTAPRPLPTTPPALPERVRRPPLLDPAQSDPIVEVQSHDPGSGTVLLGTGFSVDRRGIWITARHVASRVCGQVVMVIGGRQTRATIAYLHPEADLAILKTGTGAPSLPFSRDRLALDQTGFSFGYPAGVLGATQDALMGRTRMHLGGRLSGITPTLTWAEERRFPETLESLGGMSGGPMLDAQGRVIGVVVAASTRRGRVHTVAPELLQQVEQQTGLFAASRNDDAGEEIVESLGGLRLVASELSQNARIAKIYCRVE
jgi:serine protease Do